MIDLQFGDQLIPQRRRDRATTNTTNTATSTQFHQPIQDFGKIVIGQHILVSAAEHALQRRRLDRPTAGLAGT